MIFNISLCKKLLNSSQIVCNRNNFPFKANIFNLISCRQNKIRITVGFLKIIRLLSFIIKADKCRIITNLHSFQIINYHLSKQILDIISTSSMNIITKPQADLALQCFHHLRLKNWQNNNFKLFNPSSLLSRRPSSTLKISWMNLQAASKIWESISKSLKIISSLSMNQLLTIIINFRMQKLVLSITNSSLTVFLYHLDLAQWILMKITS